MDLILMRCNYVCIRCIARKALIRADSRIICILRSALPWRSRSLRRGVSKAATRTGVAACLASPQFISHLQTSDRSIAADWFRRFEGAGLDGVMAKDPAGTYEPNKRVMLKVKTRTRLRLRCCWIPLA